MVVELGQTLMFVYTKGDRVGVCHRDRFKEGISSLNLNREIENMRDSLIKCKKKDRL
ncbi:hypothetical protein G9F72_023855 [Clostridium estertheticum]|uniref:hypothetical protein n=1 Tax=Clostridium estertheticum TaxID=238834 RepID=UPI0013E95BC6|nr:hypothetical protein [Clostridium estertheticum]MBZ9689335.1 hypothetical protein [Clostridium estertheticum]